MASARNVHELGSAMITESDQSSENRSFGSSPAEESQPQSALGWGEPAGLVPPWSVPPGLVVPSPRPPDPETHLSQEPVDDGDAWPGVARPAEWFLRAPQPAPSAPQPPPSAADTWRTTGIPSPRREPDGTWSSPLTPAASAGTNTAQAAGPTKALAGRAGSPGLPPARTAEGGGPRPPPVFPRGQRPRLRWNEAGFHGERRPPMAPPRPHPPASVPVPRQHAPGRHVRPGSLPPDRPPAAWPGPMPLGAPVFATPAAEDDGAAC